MTVLVMSDSHGNELNVRRAIEESKGHIDCIVHLGDGIFDALDVIYDYDIALYTVSGNLEQLHASFIDGMHPVYSQILDLGGINFYCTHGHNERVKYGLSFLAKKAFENGCKYSLFGHTHVPCNKKISLGESSEEVSLFNPGSINNRNDPSYGILYVNDGIVNFTIKYVT